MNPDIFLLTGAVGACLLLAVFVVAAVGLHHRRAAARTRLTEARARAGLPDPAPDNVPGVSAADLDECQLIYSLPAYGTTTDHTTEGEL